MHLLMPVVDGPNLVHYAVYLYIYVDCYLICLTMTMVMMREGEENIEEEEAVLLD